jgi:mono/diheme cytochrome c family protein
MNGDSAANERGLMLTRLQALALVLAVSGSQSALAAAVDLAGDILRGKQLTSEIGCAQCHLDLPQNVTLRDFIPDLSSAGFRYQPAWIFEFLQNPTRVRHHLGRARMPGFALTPKEALALTTFLEAQRHISGTWPAIPAAVAPPATSPRPDVSKEQFHGELARGLICLTCHDYAGQGGHRAVELTNVSLRLRPEWVAQYLVAPARFGVPATTMPAQFFQLADDRSAFRELMPGAAQKIRLVTDHLFSLNAPRRAVLEGKLADARRAFPDLTVAQGESLFRTLNCAACHRHHSIAPLREGAAPSLAFEGLRVQKNWLAAFLSRPAPVRPFGSQPGDGARMPDFRLGPDEVRDLSAFLLSQQQGPVAGQAEYKPEPRTAFAMKKALLLFTDKFSCLGCHRFGEQGGRIGPDLTQARQRLQPRYLLSMIRDPRATCPHSIMPQTPVPNDTVRLLADFLLQHEVPAGDTRYLSPLEHPLIALAGGVDDGAPASSRAKHNYTRACAPCHGANGQGDGFNAAFLAAKPTPHANAALMSMRPDDTLFDGIHAGASILGKSHLMPGWGNTFSTEEIRELVRYIRGLCRCEGPAWSHDDARSP